MFVCCHRGHWQQNRAEKINPKILSWVVFFAFYTHAITLPFAARSSDTKPRFEARAKTAPAAPS